jgi:SAM-dependent methyltransferase
MYFGSSNLLPIYGIELDYSRQLSYVGTARALIGLHPEVHGWRFVSLCLWGVVAVSLANADEKDREKWDRRYATEEYVFGKSPVAFLRDNVSLLPKGKVLDIAMGEGRNGVFLATQGFEVLGLDISEKGLRKAHDLAKEFNSTIETRVVDLEKTRLLENEYDVIVMTYYLQRDLFPQIKAALKPGGIVVIETHHVGFSRLKPEFPREYLLGTHELWEAFQDFNILAYEYRDDGKSAHVSILARRP